MSSDEQFIAIGRMTTERADVRRQIALLAREIQDAGKTLYEGGTHLMRANPDVQEMEKGVIQLQQIRGGLERILAAVADYKRLVQRQVELSTSLRDAGAE
jgi:hypothetical protein